MAVYVIASLTIKDAVRFEDYKRTVLPSMEKYGGRFVARGGPIHVLDNSKLHTRGCPALGPKQVSSASAFCSGLRVSPPLVETTGQTLRRHSAVASRPSTNRTRCCLTTAPADR
jgi:hypothetical protein